MHGYDASDGLQLLAALLVLGVTLNHMLVLLLSDLKQALAAGGLLSLGGWICLLMTRRRGVTTVVAPAWLIIFITLYLACLSVVLVEPVAGWDARSIWFFHGKMIFYHASFDAAGAWSNPLIGFSHTDYPKLVPVLSAQTAFVAGYWNEYLPKLGLVALLVPALLAMIAILRDKRWQLFLIAIPLLFTNVWLKNGYMDGYLALYAGLAAFYWGRWLDDCKRLDLVSGMLFTGIVLNLKNEGMLFGLIVACLTLLFMATKREKLSAYLAGRYEAMILLPLVTTSVLLWWRKKHLFGLKNDLQLGLHSLDRVQERFADGSLKVILERLYVSENVNLSFGIFLISLTCVFARRRRPGKGSLFCALTGILYFSGIVMIYMATPFDLISFHLPTGDRTMLPVHLILLAAAFSLHRPTDLKASDKKHGS